MSDEQLKAFLAKVKADTSLQENLKAAADSDAVLAIAKETGFMLSTDDLNEAKSMEMSDDELESAAGGGSMRCSQYCGTYSLIDDCKQKKLKLLYSMPNQENSRQPN